MKKESSGERERERGQRIVLSNRKYIEVRFSSQKTNIHSRQNRIVRAEGEGGREGGEGGRKKRGKGAKLLTKRRIHSGS